MTSSVLSQFSTLDSQLTELKTKTVSTLLSGGDSIASMTYNICTAASDSCTISTIAQKVAEVAGAAEAAGASEDALENISSFASALQEQGYSTLDIISYLGEAQALAESDIDEFNEVFADSDDTTGTVISAIETETEETDDTDTNSDTDTTTEAGSDSEE